MKVKELIESLQKFPLEMEVIDYMGDTFDELHYKRVYDSQYPYEEIELAVCIDFKNNYKPMDLAELKDILKCQMRDYPDMYKDNESVKMLLNNSPEFDSDLVYTGWTYYGENKKGKPIFKLTSFRNLNA